VSISSLQIDQILLHESSTVTYNLNTSFVDHAHLPTVTVQLSNLDLNELKRMCICLENNHMLSFSSALFSDMVGWPVVPIPASTPEPVPNHTRSTTSPQLVDFAETNLVTGRITHLSFLKPLIPGVSIPLRSLYNLSLLVSLQLHPISCMKHLFLQVIAQCWSLNLHSQICLPSRQKTCVTDEVTALSL